jgi:DNA replication protein DnaC
MVEDQEIILAAQERLLKKREGLKAMESPTPLTMNFKPEQSIIIDWEERDRLKQKEYNEQEYKEHMENPEKYLSRYIPRKFLSKSLQNFIGEEKIIKVCMEYVNGFEREKTDSAVYGKLLRQPGSIVFTGKTGCGKTHLAVGIARELEKRTTMFETRFITAPELLLEIRATFKPHARKYNEYGQCDAETEQDVLDKYSKCELLILDDLGAEKVSDFTIQSLYLVIDRRNRELRPTIVTTNLSLEEIETMIDARMASRLADMTVVKLTMPDYRKKR